MNNLKNLIAVATKLDEKGLTKAADFLDRVIIKLSQHDTDSDFLEEESDVDLTEMDLGPTDEDLDTIEDEQGFMTFEDYEEKDVATLIEQLKDIDMDLKSKTLTDDEKEQLKMCMEELMLAVSAGGPTPIGGFEIGDADSDEEPERLVAEARRRR